MTDKQKYRLFCNDEKNIPLFSKDWWLDSVCGENGWNVVLVEIGGAIVASMPYCITKKAIFDIISMPALTQSMGPYIKYPPDQKYEKKLGYEKKVMNRLIDQLPKSDYFFQNFHYRVTNWLPFYWRGYKQSTRYTYVLEDLSDLDTVFDGFDSSYKNKVRKAQKTIQIKKNMDIDLFYTINMMTFERQNIAHPYLLEFIRKHDKALRENNAREIFYATDEKGQIHSALYLTWDSCSSYVHMVGEHPELRKSAAGILLVWEAIRFTKEALGLNRFDFEGSMIESVEQVRRSFGATQIPYFQISKINSRLYKTVALAKELLK